MHLYLLRHAHAEDLELGHLDQNRKLTLKGHDQAKSLRRTLQTLEIHFDTVISSPWRRARQTASALESISENLEVSELLAAPPSQALLHLIAEQSQTNQCLLLIGHQPWISQLTSLLLTGDSSFEMAFEYKKCSLYALDHTAKQTYLRFVLPPGVLRRLS
jgi:phosphohistidine phosphatase